MLAPDIDPYAPYLDAVFGAHGQAGAIPYAVADTSPLAGEPLAAVFLRLLALPVARFGLEDMLDLLASPPLAEAAGLDAADFERLHGWLHAAGARWGLDAAHRARLGAPADDAHTWQFALDRLLLGHASGSDAPLHGIDGQSRRGPDLKAARSMRSAHWCASCASSRASNAPSPSPCRPRNGANACSPCWPS